MMIMIMENNDIKDIAGQFQIDGEFIEARPHGSGHINDTYLGCYKTGQGVKRFVHQRINHNVFKRPEELMENIERVTGYARQRIIEAGGEPERETLTLVPTWEGKSFYKTAEGEYWRTYVFIHGARTYEVVEDLRHVYSAAKAFGNFQKLLDSLPGNRLHETIPGFHHTRRRFEAFRQAIEKDAAHRVRSTRREIDFFLKREVDCLSGARPVGKRPASRTRYP